MFLLVLKAPTNLSPATAPFSSPYNYSREKIKSSKRDLGRVVGATSQPPESCRNLFEGPPNIFGFQKLFIRGLKDSSNERWRRPTLRARNFQRNYEDEKKIKSDFFFFKCRIQFLEKSRKFSGLSWNLDGIFFQFYFQSNFLNSGSLSSTVSLAPQEKS